MECRGWPPPRRLVGSDEVIAIHAGAHIGGRPGAVARREGLLGVGSMARSAGLKLGISVSTPHPEPRHRTLTITIGERGDGIAASSDDIVTSAVVGTARVLDVVRPAAVEAELRDGVREWWIPETWGWVLEFKRLPTPIPCAGAQQLWEVPAHISAFIEEQRSWRTR